MWEPGTAHGCHAVTYGWLAGELVRRVGGRRIGQYSAEEVAGPLGLDFWIGLPESDEPRASRLEAAPARMYAATVGAVDGVRLIDDATMEAVRAEAVNGPDACLVVPSRFGMGFMLDIELAPMLSSSSFGHAGAGGSLGYADPGAQVGYGYVMNQMGGGIAGDPRTINLTDAVRSCL